MKQARSLARLNGRILATYSRRTTTALRAALPLRLALPHLEPVLALNVEKEVEKDRLVILRARELAGAATPDWNALLPQLLQLLAFWLMPFILMSLKLPKWLIPFGFWWQFS